MELLLPVLLAALAACVLTTVLAALLLVAERYLANYGTCRNRVPPNPRGRFSPRRRLDHTIGARQGGPKTLAEGSLQEIMTERRPAGVAGQGRLGNPG